MRIKRVLRALAHPSTPPPWSQNPRKRPRTRKHYPPAPAPIVTPSITSPPGYPRLLASARREPIEPAQWPPSPTIRAVSGRAPRALAGGCTGRQQIGTTPSSASWLKAGLDGGQRLVIAAALVFVTARMKDATFSR